MLIEPTMPPLMRDLPERLSERLSRPLPGRAGQARFEPELSYGRHFGPAAQDARQAAVAVLLYPHEGAWQFPLIVRPTTMQLHAGQISLPGGAVDPGETDDQAVLRELYEELGVPSQGVRLLGRLSPLYLFVTNFVMHPWVAVVSERPEFVPEPAEVAKMFEMPLLELTNPEHHGWHTRRNHGVTLRAPHFAWGRHRIWGATGMILGELSTVLDDLSILRT